MADLRIFLAVTHALNRLCLRHGTREVLAVIEDWVGYMHRVEEIVARYQVPDTTEELTP